MKFQPGNKIRQGSKNPNAGRRPSLKTQAKRWIEENPDRYAEIMNQIMAMGKGREFIKCPKCKTQIPDPIQGNLEALIYVVNREKGRPTARTEMDIKRDEGLLTGDTLVKLYQMMDAHSKQQALTEGSLAEYYTNQYGDRENWPDWAINAVDHPGGKLLNYSVKSE